MDQDKRTLDFLRLFVRHQQEIYAYILTLVPHVHDADDLFQEGMTVMWRKFDQFEPGTNFAAWGVQIMRYLILDYRRNLARNKRALMEDSVFEALMNHIPAIQDEMAVCVDATMEKGWFHEGAGIYRQVWLVKTAPLHMERCSQFGILDLCGFPKDNAYYYRSWWTDQPVLHLLPHWNWPGKEGQDIEVWCHSNGEEVELFLNGRSQSRKTMKKNSHLEWTVKYAPGTLLARGCEAVLTLQSQSATLRSSVRGQ